MYILFIISKLLKHCVKLNLRYLESNLRLFKSIFSVYSPGSDVLGAPAVSNVSCSKCHPFVGVEISKCGTYIMPR